MQGIPKNYSTRFDVEVSLEMFPDKVKAWLRDQYEHRFVWYTVKPTLYKIGDTYLDENGDTQTYTENEPWEESETSKVVEMTDEEGNIISRSGLTYMVDPNHYLTRVLNFSWEEIEALLAE